MAELVFKNHKLGKESIMSMLSKYPDHACKKCGAMIKEGDTIVKVAAGHFCINEICPNVSSNFEEPEEPRGTQVPTTDGFVTFINKEVCMLQEIETIVKDKLGPGAVDAKVGMFVKEIYRQQKLRENAP